MAKLASVHLKDVLVAAGYTFAGSGDWAIYLGKMPTAPNRVITLYDAPGVASNPKWLLNYPSVQIKVRGGVADYQVAGDKIDALHELLVGRPSFNALDSSGDRIVSITSMGSYSFLERDENDKPIWVMNLSLIVEPAARAETQREAL